MSKERELLKKEVLSEPEPDLVYDLKSWENGYAAGRSAENERLLAQPEQPPMTQLPCTSSPMTPREMYQRGYAAAERDLKREPLSDEGVED